MTKTSDTYLGIPRTTHVFESGILSTLFRYCKDKGRETENKGRHSLPKELLPEVQGRRDTAIPRDRRHRGHTNMDTFLENYSGNHTAIQARDSPSPAPGKSQVLPVPDSGNRAYPPAPGPPCLSPGSLGPTLV